jgi:type IV secretory pathway TrbL component
MVAAGAGLASVGGSSLSNAASSLATKSAYAAGATSGAYRADGLAGVAGAAASAMGSPLRSAASSLQSSFASGVSGNPGSTLNGGGASSADGPPDWARRMRRNQLITNGASQTIHAVKSGHEGGGGSSVDLSEG